MSILNEYTTWLGTKKGVFGKKVKVLAKTIKSEVRRFIP